MVIPLRDENPTRRFPIVTVALIVVNLVVYFGFQLGRETRDSDIFGRLGLSEGDEFVYEYAAIPCELKTGKPLSPLEIARFRDGSGRIIEPSCDSDERIGEADPRLTRPVFSDKNVWLAVLFSMFMHGSILHILGNMLFLWIFGNNVEDRLGPFGYLVFYLVTGAAAAATHVIADLDSVTPVVGASGAIAGVMGAYIVWYPHARVLSLVPIFFFFTFVELPAVFVLGLWFVLQFFTSPDTGVAWLAHVGGFVAGAGIAFALKGALGPPEERPRRAPPSWGRRMGGGWGDDGDWDGGFRGGYRGRT